MTPNKPAELKSVDRQQKPTPRHEQCLSGGYWRELTEAEWLALLATMPEKAVVTWAARVATYLRAEWDRRVYVITDRPGPTPSSAAHNVPIEKWHGPCGDWACPRCGNSMPTSTVPEGHECDHCKLVFKTPDDANSATGTTSAQITVGRDSGVSAGEGRRLGLNAPTGQIQTAPARTAKVRRFAANSGGVRTMIVAGQGYRDETGVFYTEDEIAQLIASKHWTELPTTESGQEAAGESVASETDSKLTAMERAWDKESDELIEKCDALRERAESAELSVEHWKNELCRARDYANAEVRRLESLALDLQAKLTSAERRVKELVKDYHALHDQVSENHALRANLSESESRLASMRRAMEPLVNKNLGSEWHEADQKSVRQSMSGDADRALLAEFDKL